MPNQGGGVLRVVNGSDGLQPFGGVTGLGFAGPFFPELPLQVSPAHGPFSDKVRSGGPGVGQSGGGFQPLQGFLVQLVPRPETEIQELLFRNLQARAVFQEYQHSPLFMAGRLNPVNPHRSLAA